MPISGTDQREAEHAGELAVTNGDDVTIEARTVRLTTGDGTASLPRILRDLSSVGLDPVAIEVHRPTLDDVFLTLTGRSLRDPV